MENVMQ